jgi:hypothetical protein
MVRGVLAAALVLSSGCGAQAGAWTQAEDRWQVISSFDIARAARGYDGQGAARAPVKFSKRFSKMLIEYGWSDSLTLIVAPEYSTAMSSWADGLPVKALDMGIEAGARLRLSEAFGVLSLQASLKYAGPYDLSHGPIQKHDGVVHGSARREELRVLYGTGFKLFGCDGFADVEAAERLVTKPFPNETVVDATAGLWLGSGTMVMAQSFNVVSGGDAEPPYTYFRLHKLELSLVQRLDETSYVQIGGFVSPAGQNSLVEEGVMIALWSHN